MNIRLISPADNLVMAGILRKSLEEFGLNIPGTAYFDESTDRLFESFQLKNSAYFVAEENGEILGGAGIYPTEGLPEDTVELVKMYMSASSRGKGIGKMLMLKCIEFAKSSNFKNIYLETMPELYAAVSAYEKLGFKSMNKPLGNTGHFSCTIWMLNELKEE
ncbi:GNAT family N-acetyltransferase [Flavobacterium piscisymbiosum]|uniref:GNAT family N-acetyltransferase n=1 Tax=Flavobacterium piscisymbiosum TaxID=2893753 RepID=A0ABS8MI25_9FLAO|nr:GNAT family N-acetyltransferase [Flavobacterium sp. F-30]MCC9065142.1 GNAT family N-acetyltransferase [Flavobacterium sp. F-30]